MAYLWGSVKTRHKIVGVRVSCGHAALGESRLWGLAAPETDLVRVGVLGQTNLTNVSLAALAKDLSAS